MWLYPQIAIQIQKYENIDIQFPIVFIFSVCLSNVYPRIITGWKFSLFRTYHEPRRSDDYCVACH